MINVSSIARTEQVATYMRIVVRWWWLPLVFAIVSGSIMHVAAAQSKVIPVYYGAITLQVSNPGGARPPNDASTYAVLMTTSPVENLASQTLHSTNGADRVAVLSAIGGAACSSDANDVFITCRTESTNARAIAPALDHLAATFISYEQRQQNNQYGSSLASLRQQEKQLKTEISALQQRLAGVQSGQNPSLTDQYRATAIQSQITEDQTSLSQLAVQESTVRQALSTSVASMQVVNPAPRAPAPIPRASSHGTELGAIVGFAIGIALIVLLEYLDDTFRSVDEVGEVTGLGILGAVRPYEQAKENAFAAWRKLHSGVAEAYRVIRTNIQFTTIDNPPKVITVTSARDGEGKSTTSVNLSIAMALSNQRVLLVDADMRRHGLSSRFGWQGKPGLSNALIDPEVEVGAPVDEIPNLTVVPAGPIPPNPAELLGSYRMTDWLAKQRAAYDIVLLDTPPVLSVADSRILAANSDGVLLLVDPTISSRRLVKQARLALDAVGTRILGTIVNKASFYSQDSYYKYYYYYDKYDTAPHPLPTLVAPSPGTDDAAEGNGEAQVG